MKIKILMPQSIFMSYERMVELDKHISKTKCLEQQDYQIWKLFKKSICAIQSDTNFPWVAAFLIDNAERIDAVISRVVRHRIDELLVQSEKTIAKINEPLTEYEI